jgi:hypothetical protein
MKNNKICTKCKVEYPITSEYFTRDKCKKDGLSCRCKKCKSDGDKASRQKHIESFRKKRREWNKNNKEIKRERDRVYKNKLKSRNPEDIVVPKTKKCRTCKEEKISNDFFKNIGSVDGLTGACKECTKSYNHNSYRKHKKSRSKSGKIYRNNNKEKIQARSKRYYAKNKNKIQEYKRRWQQKHKKRNAKREKLWRQTHKKQQKEYHRKRRQDIDYRILSSLRVRLWHAMRANSAVKSRRTMELVGCSIPELKKHIQSLFSQGMTFDNYGKDKGRWSIDHIRPCALFDLSDPEQQKICFHYTNLRPLWSTENMSKNSFYNGKYIRKNKGVI